MKITLEDELAMHEDMKKHNYDEMTFDEKMAYYKTNETAQYLMYGNFYDNIKKKAQSELSKYYIGSFDIDSGSGKQIRELLKTHKSELDVFREKLIEFFEKEKQPTFKEYIFPNSHANDEFYQAFYYGELLDFANIIVNNSTESGHYIAIMQQLFYDVFEFPKAFEYAYKSEPKGEN